MTSLRMFLQTDFMGYGYSTSESIILVATYLRSFQVYLINNYNHVSLFGLQQNKEHLEDSANTFIIQVLIEQLSVLVDLLDSLNWNSKISYSFLLALVEIGNYLEKVPHKDFISTGLGMEYVHKLKEVVLVGVAIQQRPVYNFVVNSQQLRTDIGQLLYPILGVVN